MYGDGAIVSQPEVATKPNNESLPESHAMKTPLFSIYVALLLLAIGHRLSAQITEIDQFKVTAYNQTNQSPPVTPDYPNAYYFAVLLYSDTNYDISLPMVFTPSATTDGEFIMNQNGPGSFGFSSPFYASKDDFDADSGVPKPLTGPQECVVALLCASPFRRYCATPKGATSTTGF